MTSVPAQTPGAHAPERTLADRLIRAVPAVALALVVLVFYGIEAWSRKTPWVFTDELEWTQISRSIAATGHAARRGQPIYFKSIYAFLIAPFWWIHSTTAAYAAIKYANAVLMTLAAVPTYLLARMLVTRRSAVIVAVLAVAVPGMAYATSIIEEVLGFPYFALCSWLSVRAFRSGRRRDLIVAAVFAVGAPFVSYPKLLTIPASFAIAAVGLWVTGPRGRALRRNWTRGDTLGALVLLAGALFLFNRVFLQHVQEWQITTQYYKNRMVDLGLRAGLSFVIGMGILPVLAGFASLRLPERRGDPTYRAFAAWASAAILCVSLYTANKAAYLSTTFATLWEGRNMIYLGPLLLVGTALVLESKRIDWRIVAAASALVAFLVLGKPFQLGYPYFEAPGFAIPAVLADYLHWSTGAVRLGSLGVLAVSLLLLAARRRRGVAMLASTVLLAWLLGGEIAMTAGIDKLANAFRANLPSQLNWVDARVHGQPVTYLGQAIRDPNGVWLTEFWNRSIKHVESLDGTAPGPGPTGTPDVLAPNGLLSGLSNEPYVLADSGVTLDATPVAKQGAMTLYHHNGPWHLVDTLQQVYDDGWCPDWCSYTYFKPNQRGVLEVTLSRTGYKGPAPPARVKLEVGSVRIDSSSNPHLKRIYRVEHVLVHNGTQETIPIPVTRTPVRVELFIPDTIPPTPTESRHLGAQVGFQFVPARG